MTDSLTTLEELKHMVRQLVSEREWEQFHTPKNLSIDITVEVGELLELFQHVLEPQVAEVVERKKSEVEQELSDVMIASLAFCNQTKIDVGSAIENRLESKKGLNMNDRETTMGLLKEEVNTILSDRDWYSFNSPKNVAMSLSVEASELMELFLWRSDEASFEICENKRTEVENELADVVINCLIFANVAKIDLAAAIEHKIELIKQKYPVEKSRGKPDKYTDL